jgi:arabinofuranan 3-O-arabinosyltransferase
MVVCTFLTALSFIQAPGLTAADTKLDLTANPQGLLARALHLWDPTGAFGQVQNQGYGYLWPIGPFHLAFDLVHLPPWVVQRAWWALVLCVAFLGMVRLADRLGIGTDSSRLVVGVAFALSPRFITELGPISVEAWPTALAPWVIVPLIDAARGAPLRRSAARSALAVACVGGVNAAAAFAVLPLAAMWLLALRPRRLAGRLAGWWVLFLALATAWWVVPLLLLGQYSPPFLDYIENATVTTGPTSLVEVLRGASHWVAYLADGAGPIWRAGSLLITTPILVVNTALVAALGMMGLARRGMPQRRWLVAALLVGVAMVAFGHVSDIDGLGAEQQRALLDGPLAPLRNVHKFDVVLRIPLLLGACHLLGILLRAAAALPARERMPSVRRAATVRRALALGLAVTAVCGVAAPALAGALPTRGAYIELPGYWRDAARWLDDRADVGTVLLAPASSFGEYYWGRPGDEPLQALLDRPWAVRNAVPLAPPGTIRMLDAVESRLTTGQGSPALASYLARGGVRYLVVRNDLDYGTANASRPLLVHQAIARSAGLKLVATFGPPVGGGNKFGTLVDQDLDLPFPAVEVFSVEVPVERIAVYPQREAVSLDGAPESVLALAEGGQLNDAPTVLEVDRDPALAAGRSVLTDGFRSRNVFFGRVLDAASETTVGGESPSSAAVRDYLPPGAGRRLTTARFVGAESLLASSSASSATAFGGARPERSPWAAFDGLASTAWWSDPVLDPVGQWAEVTYENPRTIPRIELEVDADAGVPVTRIRVDTDRGSVDGSVVNRQAQVTLPWESVRRVRVVVTGVAGKDPHGSVGIREVRTGTPAISRPLVLPTPTGVPSSVSFSAAPGDRDACYRVGDRPVCAVGVARYSEDATGIDRIADVGEPGDFRVSLRGRIVPGPALDDLLSRGRTGVRATSSSAAVPDPAGQAVSAVDGDRGTGWVAAPGDRTPWIRFQWAEPRSLTGLRLDNDGALAASLPDVVTVESPDGVRRGTVRDGVLTFDRPLRTTDVRVRFGRLGLASSIDPYTRQLAILPVGVSEVEFLGAADLRVVQDRGDRLVIPCGSGPTVRVGDEAVRTALSATRNELETLAPVLFLPCSRNSVRLGTGPQRITADSTALVRVTGLDLVRVTSLPAKIQPADRIEATSGTWEPTHRTVRVAARAEPALLVVRENTNPGWEATLDGTPLRRVTVDGWQQGYLLPRGGAGVVELVYGPDGTYRWALLLGALTVLTVVCFAVFPWRARRLGSVGSASAGGVPVTALGAIALVLATGWWGIGVAGVVSVVALIARGSDRIPARWGVAVRELVVAGAVLAAGLMLAGSPWPSPGYNAGSRVVQLLCVVPLAVLWQSLLPRFRTDSATGGQVGPR